MQRIETNNWSIQGGIVTGHSHLARQSNCQDNISVRVHQLECITPEMGVIASDPSIIAAAVCDGCGSSQSSEVGATLISRYITQRSIELIKSGCHVHKIPDILFQSLPGYLKLQLYLERMDNIIEDAAIINDTWLCSIVALVIHENFGLIFHCGDPVYAIDDKLVVVDQQNEPSYIAYRCLDNKYIDPSHVPQSFTTVLFDAAETKKIMISSDGFVTFNKNKFAEAKEKEPDLNTSLHGQQWNRRGNVGLQLWMNTRHQKGYFDDDCGIVVVERKFQ
jgi:hypothetical protein